MAIGERILQALNYSGKNQADLARYLSTKPSTVTGWIKEGRIPSANSVIPICEFTGVGVNWLLTGEGDMFVDKKPEQLHGNNTADNNLMAISGSGNTIMLQQPTQLSPQLQSSPPPVLELGVGEKKIRILLPNSFTMDDLSSFALICASAISGAPLMGAAGYALFKFLVPSAEKLGESMPQNINSFFSYLKENLLKRGITNPRPVSPSLALEAARALPFEGREELRKLWGNLLANAMDPNFKENKVLSAYISIIKDLSPLDVRALRLLKKLTDTNKRYYFPLTPNDNHFEEYKTELDPNAEDIELSVENLIRLRLVDTTEQIDIPSVRFGKLGTRSVKFDAGDAWGRDDSEIMVETEKGLAPGYIHFTAFGLGFLEACGDK
ncbi:hypothetical protein AGMMS49957_01810 [Synergistales bacterium]|nr:hypothetical protein AGMMS49957_01810 [Synergistales bacterium]